VQVPFPERLLRSTVAVKAVCTLVNDLTVHHLKGKGADLYGKSGRTAAQPTHLADWLPYAFRKVRLAVMWEISAVKWSLQLTKCKVLLTYQRTHAHSKSASTWHGFMGSQVLIEPLCASSPATQHAVVIMTLRMTEAQLDCK
jgi:hypothetical protein